MKRTRILLFCLVLTAIVLAGLIGYWAWTKSSAEAQLPEDGTYEISVTLTGGSGRASVESPTRIRVQGGKMTASITWSSPYYDYMIVAGEKLLPITTDPVSVFEIPVAALDAELAVTADTVAMSVPHEIEYTLRFDSATLKTVETAAPDADAPNWAELPMTGELPLRFAAQYRVLNYAGGYSLLEITDSGRFLIVPENAPTPKGIEADIVVLKQPIERIYLAATSAMDFFRAIDAIDSIRFSALKADGWFIPEARQALEDGRMIYAGKYRAPDYERIYSGNCGLAIESTMIYHTPEVKEKLEKIGIPVLVERSSYENDPLGRMEWIKVYGLLTGKLEAASDIFDREITALSELKTEAGTEKTTAFFYVTTTGTVNVRKSQDYVVKMITMAGGSYVFPNLGENGNALSTVNMTIEAFYEGAKNADILIYNSTIDGELETIAQLLSKSVLFKDFKAVQNGDVWCTGKNLYQEPMGLSAMIRDLNQIFTQSDPDPVSLTYLHRLTDGN